MTLRELGARPDEVPSLCMDRTEVTVAAYGLCVRRRACAIPVGEHCTYSSKLVDHPVNCVSFAQAERYCHWLGRRLPTMAEWVWAARGANSSNPYPWGDTSLGGEQVCGEDRAELKEKPWYARTCPVGIYEASDSPQGISDLAGNVSEWIQSDAVQWSDGEGRELMNSSAWSPPRGGMEKRDRRKAAEGYADVGFRCVRSLGDMHRDLMCLRPPVVFEDGFPGQLRTEASRMADVLNCGSQIDLADLGSRDADLLQFWSAYARRGDIGLRATPGASPEAFTLCDASSGMSCCRAARTGGAWRLGDCEFNDGL